MSLNASFDIRTDFHMNDLELKKRLSSLWKETFHDSDDYISLIFDNYFSPDLCAYEEADGQLVAGLIGIPYDFGNADRKVSGLYLCGLATKPQFRSRGIMTRLLAHINSVAKEKGFAFTFLIPADPGLRLYYHDRDYVNAFYRVVDNYTSVHDFDLEYESILQEQKDKVIDIKRRYYQALSVEDYDASNPLSNDVEEGIIVLISGIESAQDNLQILHSERDLRLILKENSLSGGTVFVATNSQNIVTGVAFTSASISENAVNIHKLFVSDMASKYKLFATIKRAFPEMGIRNYVSSIEMDRKALWSRTYGSFLPEAPQAGAISVTERVYSLAAHAKVYGMVRVLDLPEILKFQAESRRNLKYSILAKGDSPYTFDKIDVRDGRLSIKTVASEHLEPSQIAYVMSKRDVCEILFRRRDSDNMITEAFGIPSINASIALLLD